MFIDETWTATNMTRSHGRCVRGERLRMGFPHGHRKTTTLVAGLRMTGMVAPMVLDGPINGDWFEAYVTQVLIPELRPGDVVVMDNLSSHKRASVRERIEAAGARAGAVKALARQGPTSIPLQIGQNGRKTADQTYPRTGLISRRSRVQPSRRSPRVKSLSYGTEPGRALARLGRMRSIRPEYDR